MNETVFGAYLVDKIGRPRASRLPCYSKRWPAYLLKEAR
jgi:hypothetical protein